MVVLHRSFIDMRRLPRTHVLVMICALAYQLLRIMNHRQLVAMALKSTVLPLVLNVVYLLNIQIAIHESKQREVKFTPCIQRAK